MKDKIDKDKIRYRLMNKLLIDKLGSERIEIDENSVTTTIKPEFSCTTEVSLIVAIAKRVGASFYLKSNGTFGLYITDKNKSAAHYLRWADDNIKREIKLIQDE